MNNKKTMFAAFVALFAVLGGAFILSAETDETDAAIASINQGEYKTFGWSALFTGMTSSDYSHQFDIGVSDKSNLNSSNEVSGIGISYSSSGVTITVATWVSAGTYYLRADDMTTEEDTYDGSFTVVAKTVQYGSSSSPLNSLLLVADNENDVKNQTFYVKSGGTVSITGASGPYFGNTVKSVTSGFGLAKSGDYINGTLSGAGTITVTVSFVDEDISEDYNFLIVSVASGSGEGDLSFTNTAPTQGISGATYNYTPTTNIPANFSKSGTWPSWLTLNTTNGKVSGTMPTVTSVQTYTATIHAVSKTLSTNTADQTITIHVYPIAQISVSGGNTITGYTGTAISKNLSCNLGATFAVKSGSSALPTGLSLSSDGKITGTPSQAVSNHKVTIEGTTKSGNGPVQKPTIVLTFNFTQPESTLNITSGTISGVKVAGSSVSQALTASVTGTTFQLQNAPAWLAIDTNNVIRGSIPTTYTTETTISFTVKATSPQGQTATQEHSFTVQPPVAFTSKPTASCIVIPIYTYKDDGSVDAGIVDDFIDGFDSTFGKRIIGYRFVFVGTNADNVTWDFGDGETGEGFTVEHEYSKPGTYTVTCTATNEYVEDGQTLTGTDSCTVDVTIDAEAGDYIYIILIVLILIVLAVLVLKLFAQRRR